MTRLKLIETMLTGIVEDHETESVPLVKLCEQVETLVPRARCSEIISVIEKIYFIDALELKGARLKNTIETRASESERIDLIAATVAPALERLDKRFVKNATDLKFYTFYKHVVNTVCKIKKSDLKKVLIARGYIVEAGNGNKIWIKLSMHNGGTMPILRRLGLTVADAKSINIKEVDFFNE